MQQQWHSNITNMNRSTLTATWVSWNTYIFFLQCSGKITMGISGTVFTSRMPFLSLYKTQSTDPRSVTNLFFTYHSKLFAPLGVLVGRCRLDVFSSFLLFSTLSTFFCLCHEHITNSVIGVSRPPVLDYGTTFHLDSGGWDLPSTLLDNL